MPLNLNGEQVNNLVFVYGSLKKGFHNHILLANSECLGQATTLPEFQMHSFGGFPALVSGDKAYDGELYKVDDKTFASLDRLEGYPEFYTRQKYRVGLYKHDPYDAWIYTLADESEAKALPIVERSSW